MTNILAAMAEAYDSAIQAGFCACMNAEQIAVLKQRAMAAALRKAAEIVGREFGYADVNRFLTTVAEQAP